ncbi:MAG: cell division ATP-binding protein FtsE [Nitriliruptoraceae bacterium]
MSDLVIRLQNVTKTYKSKSREYVHALQDISLEVGKGEFVFIVGPSGSGKSTFMKLLTREQMPDQGEIWVAGRNLGTLRSWKIPALRREIGYVYQDFKLLGNKTVTENVAFALEVLGKSRREIERRVPEVLDLVGLDGKENARPHELSGGQQQRVSIARAFVNNPRILLCDEPTGNLDPTTSVGIMKLLDRINRTGATVVMATHDQQIVDSMRRRVVELEDGAIVRDQSRGVYGYTG